MAHQLIGFFTVPDKKDGVLKVLRSYQYYAVSAITTVVAKHDWESRDQRGGFIWHTTGSGKTLTSFKTADLISKSGDADKVVFLVDRKELDAQSYDNYKNFADTDVKVSQVDSTDELISTMKSSSSDDALIVASIQKMYRIFDDGSRKRDKDSISRVFHSHVQVLELRIISVLYAEGQSWMIQILHSDSVLSVRADMNFVRTIYLHMNIISQCNCVTRAL